MQKVIHQAVDLQAGGGQLCWPNVLAVQGESYGHRWEVQVLDGGKPCNLAGATALCHAVNGGASIPMTASISGNVASVEFHPACYAQPGELKGLMSITMDGRSPTVALLRLRVHDGITDTIIDPEGKLPSLTELLVLLEQIATDISDARDAAAAAKQAKNGANSAANRANAAAEVAEDAASDAILATLDADDATDAANAAAQSIERMTIETASVPYGTSPQATITDVEGHKHIALQVEQGPQGLAYTIVGRAYDTLAELDTEITDPEMGELRNVGIEPPYNVYRWTGPVTRWEDQGQTQGPPGQDGLTISVCGVEQVDGDVALTGEHIPVSAADHTSLANALEGKVDTVAGKGLSANDYTAADKAKLDGFGAASTYALKPKVYTATLFATNWVDHQQTVSLPGMSANSVVIPAVATSAIHDAFADYGKRYCRAIIQSAGTLTFTCESAPTVDIPILVLEVF